MLTLIVYVLVIALVCGGIVYVLDRTPFISEPFNAIIKVVVVIAGVVAVLQRLGVFTGPTGLLR